MRETPPTMAFLPKTIQPSPPISANNISIRQLGTNPVLRQNPVSPKSPKMVVKTGNPVVATTAKVVTPRSGMNFQIQDSSPQTATARFQPTKIAQVQIPTVQNRKENRKSIETTALMLANRELLTVATQQTPQKIAEKTSPPLSPPEMVTPPSSERSTSGDGKGKTIYLFKFSLS